MKHIKNYINHSVNNDFPNSFLAAQMRSIHVTLAGSPMF